VVDVAGLGPTLHPRGPVSRMRARALVTHVVPAMALLIYLVAAVALVVHWPCLLDFLADRGAPPVFNATILTQQVRTGMRNLA